MTLARGYGSIPIWRDMHRRFKQSKKDQMTLIVVSDFDPEGFDLADDAIRSLRDLWNINVDYCRVGVNREQIDELDLHADFNPAKESSSRIEAFRSRTGGDETWEVESLPPEYLQQQVKDAILGNMDLDIFEMNNAQESSDVKELAEFRDDLVGELGL